MINFFDKNSIEKLHAFVRYCSTVYSIQSARASQIYERWGCLSRRQNSIASFKKFETSTNDLRKNEFSTQRSAKGYEKGATGFDKKRSQGFYLGM